MWVVALTYYAHLDKMKIIGQEVNVERLNNSGSIYEKISDAFD